ncbi:MAG: S49 family peptidase [bacterium]
MSKLTETAHKIIATLPFIDKPKPMVTHIDLFGVIATDGRTGKNLNLKRIEKALDAAFAPSNLAAVALSVNSPGGSPVQSRLIHDRIRQLAAEKDVPVLTFVEDVGASGGYILAISGDEIFADRSSIIGSIGVIMSGFGFVEAIHKLGIERRVHTAGSNKSQMDPFQPEKPEQVKHNKFLLDSLHDIFIDLVKSRRGDKLSDDKDIFSGLYWPADTALNLGLIDAIGEVRSVLKERFGKDVKIKQIPVGERGLLAKIMARATPAPSGLIDPDDMIDAIERKSLWTKFGL